MENARMIRPSLLRPGLVLCLTLSLAACGFGQSRLNPLNWFGSSQPAARVEQPLTPGQPQDGRERVSQVLSMAVEPIGSGAIIRATGLTPTQGWWKASLVELPQTEPGVLVLDFRIMAPPKAEAVNSPRSREVTVALHLSRTRLADIRTIVVQGANDARSAGR